LNDGKRRKEKKGKEGGTRIGRDVENVTREAGVLYDEVAFGKSRLPGLEGSGGLCVLFPVLFVGFRVLRILRLLKDLEWIIHDSHSNSRVIKGLHVHQICTVILKELFLLKFKLISGRFCLLDVPQPGWTGALPYAIGVNASRTLC
jgi:hypothetical protein